MLLRRATVLLLSLISSRVVAQAPHDSVVITAAHKAVEIDASQYGRPCAFGRNTTVIFARDTIAARGEMTVARGQLPFRVTSTGLIACVSGGVTVAYPFDYQTVVRFKPDEFKQWTPDGSLIESRPAPPKTVDATRTLVQLTAGYLREMVTAEEAYFSDHGRYTANLSELRGVRGRGISPATIEVLPNGSGWRATADAPLVGMRCGIGLNTTNPIALEAGEGEPACRKK